MIPPGVIGLALATDKRNATSISISTLDRILVQTYCTSPAQPICSVKAVVHAFGQCIMMRASKHLKGIEYRYVGIKYYRWEGGGIQKVGGSSSCDGDTRVSPPVVFVVVEGWGVTPLLPSMMLVSRIRVRVRVGLGRTAFTGSATGGWRGIGLWQRDGFRNRRLLRLLRGGGCPLRLGGRR